MPDPLSRLHSLRLHIRSNIFGASIWAKAEPRQSENSSNVSDTVRSHKFVLIDANNKERGTIKMIAGSPQLSLRDEDGGQIAVLNLNSLYFNSSEQIIRQRDRATEYRTTSELGVNKDGAGYMRVYDHKHKTNVFVGSPDGESPKLQVTKNDKPIFLKP